MGYEERESVPFSALSDSYLFDIREDHEGHLWFFTSKGVFWMGYHPDCCASCNIDEVFGDPAELLGAYITSADEPSSDDPGVEVRDFAATKQYIPESYTWTFYRLQTPKGDLVIRWFGSSNGYYSETASFEKAKIDNLELLAGASVIGEGIPGTRWNPKCY